jgi:hypothetical protein
MALFPDQRRPSTTVIADPRFSALIPVIMRSLRLAAAILGLHAAAAGHAGPPAPGALPDPGGVAEAFFAARRWLDGAGDPPRTPADVRSAAVVLRLHGRLAGLGKDDGAGPAEGIVDRALRAALADATEKARVQAVAGDAPPGGIGPLLSLELELAGTREPLVGRTFEELAKAYEPAECGLQLVDGSRTAYEPASHLLARRMTFPPSLAVLAMLKSLDLPPRDLPDLQALGGATALYASRGIRLAQLEPGGTPFTPARVLPATGMSPASRPSAADACSSLVARLAAQLDAPASAEGVPAEAAAQLARTGLRGDYAIPSDRYEPFVARPADQAMVAWSLARASAVESWPVPLRESAARTAGRILDALAEVDAAEGPPQDDPVAVAGATLAMHDLRAPADRWPALRAELAKALTARLEPAALASAAPAVRALLLDAAAACDAGGTPAIDRARLRADLLRILAETRAAELPVIAPFAFDALRRLDGDAWPSGIATGRDAIDAARTVLLATQVRPMAPDRPASLADTAGAFPLTGSSTGRIGAQSARAQVFVAMLAGLPGTRSAARDDEDRASLGWAGRFLLQLQAPPGVSYCAPAADRALGGILASPADASQPVAAQAMAILALAESELAFARMDAPSAGGR